MYCEHEMHPNVDYDGKPIEPAEDICINCGCTATQIADSPQWLGGFTREDGEYGDSRTHYSVWKLPEHMTDDEIGPWVEANFPATRCQHSYDCCGNFYRGKGVWSYVEDGLGSKSEIIVRQTASANI